MKHANIAAALFSIGAISGTGGVMAADFTGPGVAAEMQFKSTGGHADYTDWSDNEDYRQKISMGGDSEVIGGLNLNFGFALAPRVVLQLGVTADLGKTDIYNVNQTLVSATETTHVSASFKEKNHYALYLAPGYLVTPKTMLYAKLAYHSMKMDWSQRFADASGTETENMGNTFKGLGLGFGLQSMLGDKLYAYAEVQRVHYGREKLSHTATEQFLVKPRSTIGALGIGYRF